MAKDHFEIHAYNQDKIDWNFNIVFGDQPQVGAMVQRYARLLNHPGLYPPVPPQWLHLTVLRAGFTTEFAESEIQKVAAKLEAPLAALKLAALTLGPAWVYKGYPLLRTHPEEPLEAVFQNVVSALRTEVGEERMPRPVDRSITKLAPHVSLAYTRNYDSEDEVRASSLKIPYRQWTFGSGIYRLYGSGPQTGTTSGKS